MLYKVRGIFIVIIFFTINGNSGVFAQKTNAFERLLNRYYKIVEGDSAKPKTQYLLAIPIWGVSPETGIKLGVSLDYFFRLGEREKTRPSVLRLNTSYTQYGQFNIRPGFDIFFNENKYFLTGQYVYNDFNEYYWGVGNHTPESAKELYDFRQHRVNLRFAKQLVKGLYVGVQGIYEKIYKLRFQDKSTAPLSGVSGINGYDNIGVGLAIVYDNRDNIYFPLRGAYLEISNLQNWSSTANKYNYQGVTIDARKYFPLWKENMVGIQGLADLNYGDIPYRQMGTMGNEMIMRGYYNGRYRDNHFVAFQTELRKTIWGPLAATFFAGLGNVGKTDLLKYIKPNYGFGLRFVVLRKEHINARMDFAFGEGKIFGFYFTMGEAF